MCGSMADIQSLTAEIRRGKKERKKKKNKQQDENIHHESKKGCHPIHGYNFVNS